ncbi:ABC transporter ATP-binding protein [Spiroplasma turonicum]|uniref:ABC transporter ATP-binding protein/permease n=1 Tax=Spiroplasma turonicum TaxID=216946 RepID=A0A0K1P5H4_9MOLU|nr:ABC transporter ATP-binding protein [Spiroplasma turonicum]AKU79556.1 ABC transporter ATP-binding protein/permease [Spiroplasma turonicum]ALX70579.1 ATP-binding cassette, subfamily B, bacterial MsbA [Spiroplasma turonicum]
MDVNGKLDNLNYIESSRISPTKNNKKKITADEKLYNFMKKKHTLKFFKIVMVYGFKHKALFFTVISVVIFSALLVSINSLLINITLNQAQYDFAIKNGQIAGKNYNLYWYYWLSITIADLVLLYICTFIRNFCSIILAVTIEVELRKLTINRLLEYDISYYSDKKTGKLMTKLVGDTNIIGNEISGLVSWIIQAPLVIIFGTTVLFFVDVYLALISSISVYLLGFIIIMITISYQKKVSIVRDVISDINGDVVDRINAIKLVKSSATRIYEENRIKKLHNPYIKVFRPISKIDGTLLAILIASDVLINLLVISSAALLYGNEDINKFITVIIPITTAMTGLTRPLWQIAAIVPGLSRASASSIKIYEVIFKDPILSDNEENGLLFDQNINTIEFRDVKFNYPEKPEINIVPNLKLNFEKGKSYAFVGETGSGKSTISKLLLRFYDPTEGCILINDVNLKDLNLRSYLSRVGYVEQEPQIIYGSVYDNVRYGFFNASDEEVHEACRKAQVHNIIMSWPENYNTILGERGLLLSGGQKQRLVIARMILRNPELLVLDEATSALDNIVEREIQSQLDELMKDKTTVIIAHRLTTIKNVDKIFVLESGKGVIQEGNYKQLINKPGRFKDLHDAANS